MENDDKKCVTVCTKVLIVDPRELTAILMAGKNAAKNSPKIGEGKLSNNKPLNRINGEDSAVAGEVMKHASYLMLPDRTISRLIAEQFENIGQLRKKGCSWSQIHTLLVHLGIDISESTLRSYYARDKKLNEKAAASTTKNGYPEKKSGRNPALSVEQFKVLEDFVIGKMEEKRNGAKKDGEH
ncbi:hypothetical protein [Ralstonia pseudosolanacearum]|uniref:hypothetical protein n=1 Tax=Ralstonia pseudosolanacearum TaxID=1310165 RepID=UPI0018D039E3|nr:hypothetical protein [Ralstonia pseudosolanacearum]